MSGGKSEDGKDNVENNDPATELVKALFWVLMSVLLILSVPIICLIVFSAFARVIQAFTWFAQHF